MLDHDGYPDEYDEDEQEPIEGYCVRCREKVEMEHTQAVWTRKGLPATQGECPLCGGAVYRMGRTDAHRAENRPAPVVIGEGGERRRQPQLTRDTVYVNYTPADQAVAQRIADDLNSAGIAAWLHQAGDPGNDEKTVHWAGGVHPALKNCARMVFVSSPASAQDASVSAAIAFFRQQKRPVIVAQVASAPVPDDLRRSPRFDFEADYRSAFRQMLQALSG